MQSKLPNVGTTIFSVMSSLAVEHNALNLSQGFPNFPVDERLLNIFKEQASLNVHQYSPMVGLTRLRQEISLKVKEHYNTEIHESDEIGRAHV